MNGNEFIALNITNTYFNRDSRYININHIVYYYRHDDRTVIELDNGKYLEVSQTCEQIKKLIDEVTFK